MAVVLLWTGCENKGMNEPRQEVSFPISICLPTDEVYAARMSGPRRVMGDPGTTEQFALPNYIYIVVMKNTSGSTWKIWRVITESGVADEGKWTKKRYIGSLYTTGDSIYQYNKEYSELLNPGEVNFNGRVYAVASKEALTFNKTLADEVGGIQSLSDVENLTFASGSVQSDIQHIYSTPYNYIVDGEYYGSFKSSQKVPRVNIMLYHVAAKVDITWNVPEDKRINKEHPENAVRLTYMEARRLFNGNAYCFKPMRNELASLIGDGEGYDRPDIVTASDEGLWWEGRSYFYTIPYIVTGNKDYFPLQMRLCTNGTDKANAYRPTLNMQIDTSDVFVPWLRANFIFKAPLEDKAETKTVDQR